MKMADNQNTDGNNNTDQNQNNDNGSGDNNQNQNQNQNNNSNPDIEKIVQERLNEVLKDFKTKLDKAYGSRDEALVKVKEFEQKEREAELKRLQEEGKHKEAFDMQLAEERALRETAEKRNVELTRDIEVRNALSSQPFKNENASEMAYREIVGQLVRNDQGVWVHKSGSTIKDFVTAFAGDDVNSFLFKQKTSSGSGSSGTKPTDSSGDKKSLFSMSQDEVLKMAREGKLPGR
jgi:uncharacterized FlaG/YvyC family protein